MSLRRRLELMTEEKFDDWPHCGPKALRELLESTNEVGDLDVFLSNQLRKSGFAEIACKS